jgi:hypothetical protein
MLIAAVLCLCAAVVSAGFGARALTRPTPAAGTGQVLRAVAPTQLAAAVMLSAGGVVALSARPSVGLLVLCVAGAVATVTAGAVQGARYAQAAARRQASCRQACASCSLQCQSP